MYPFPSRFFLLFFLLCAANSEENVLYLNHIPKTGGTTLENLDDIARNLSDCKIHFDSRKRLSYSDHCRTKSDEMTLTNLHCWHKLNPSFAEWKKKNPEVSLFCFIRDPITRFLSTYNMRAAGHFKFYKKGDECNREHMHEYLNSKYIKGELDNHDVPQAAYYCDLHFCFEDFQYDVFNLFRIRGAPLIIFRPKHTL